MTQRKKATLQVIENAAFYYCYVVEMGEAVTIVYITIYSDCSWALVFACTQACTHISMLTLELRLYGFPTFPYFWRLM